MIKIKEKNTINLDVIGNRQEMRILPIGEADVLLLPVLPIWVILILEIMVVLMSLLVIY